MEGAVAGSRLSRTSSRYGQQQSSSSAARAANFSGPVRRWQKKWVVVSSPPSRRKPNINSYSSSGGNGGVLLCKWTPLARPETGATGGTAVEEPPRRKIRYTPITAVEQLKGDNQGLRKCSNNNNETKTGKEDSQEGGDKVGEEEHMVWNSAAAAVHDHETMMLNMNESPTGYYQVSPEEFPTTPLHQALDYSY